MAILCPYNTFSEVLEDTKESNLVGPDKLNCDQEIASQRNFNGPTFAFEHLQHGSQFSLAIFAQNSKVGSILDIEMNIYINWHSCTLFKNALLKIWRVNLTVFQ